MWPSSLLLHLHFALLPWQLHQNRKPLWNSTMQPGMHISRNVTICVLDTPTLLWLACSVPLIPPACSSICWPVGGESAICKKNSIYRWIYKKNVFCFPWFPLASLLWMQMETYLFLLLIYFYICYYTSLKSAWSLLLGELVRLVHCNVNSLCISPHGQKHRHAHGRPQGPLCNVATTYVPCLLNFSVSVWFQNIKSNQNNIQL